jgi:hypothetical protein
MGALSTNLLRESGSWLAASLLAGKYFQGPGTKFVTCYRHQGTWIATQWVTTSSGIFGSAAQVCPGRVGISRRRRKAFNSMTAQRWSASVPEPPGLTVGVQIYARLGKQ